MDEQSASSGELDVDEGDLAHLRCVCRRAEDDQAACVGLDVFEPRLAIWNFKEQLLHILHFPLHLAGCSVRQCNDAPSSTLFVEDSDESEFWNPPKHDDGRGLFRCV